MAVSYNKLWKLLIDRNMTKKELREAAGVSVSFITKLGNNASVRSDMLAKICNALKCNIGDIMDVIPESEPITEEENIK